MSTGPSRKPLSKRLRFEIFKRDGFRCVYCGATPNDGPLHVDHVKPVAGGGSSDHSNLVMACQSCNGGKSAIPLDRRALPPLDPDAAREHAEQIRAWAEAQGQVMEAKRSTRQAWVDYWCDVFGETGCSADVAPRMLKVETEWGTEKTCEAISIVADRHIRGDTNRLKYLYGVLRKWREVKTDEEFMSDAEFDAFAWTYMIWNQFGMYGGVI